MSKLMDLYTVQPENVWQKLQQSKILYTDENHKLFHPNMMSNDKSQQDPQFLRAYDWLKVEMQRKIPGYGISYPWWAWTVRPDLRAERFLYSTGKAMCLLHLRLPEHLVLLSEFFVWGGFIINGQYVSLSAQDDQEFEERWKQLVGGSPPWFSKAVWTDSLMDQYKREVVQSWNRVFEAEQLTDAAWHGECTWQATFEKLRLSDVQSCTKFIGAKKIAN